MTLPESFPLDLDSWYNILKKTLYIQKKNEVFCSTTVADSYIEGEQADTRSSRLICKLASVLLCMLLISSEVSCLQVK